MKKLCIIAIVIFMVCIVSGCNTNDPNDITYYTIPNNQNSFNYLKNIVNAGRRTIIENSEPVDLSQYSNNYKSELNIFTDNEIEQLCGNKQIKFCVTKAEALEDTDTLFKILKVSYGAYWYFGGDTVFIKAQNAIIDNIKEKKDNYISIYEFTDLICTNLSFIQDGHFRVNNKRLCEKQNMYFCNKYNIKYKNDRYYILYNDKEYAIVSINGSTNISDYVKPTISKNGELCYSLYSIFKNDIEAENCKSMKVKQFTEETEIAIQWQKSVNFFANQSVEEYSKTIVDGINIYSVRSMCGNEDLLNKFCESAKEAKDKNLFIIDLRGNSGGSDIYAINWYNNYNGFFPQRACSYIQKLTPLSLESLKTFNPNIEELYSTQDYENMKNGTWNYDIENGLWVDNKNIIIVLIDKNVASSGESMIEYLRSMNNVIFVGSNSNGCSLVPNNSYKYLPNSGMELYFGQGLCLTDDYKNRDGVGFLPDIWVNPFDSLDLVIKMCSFYELNK